MLGHSFFKNCETFPKSVVKIIGRYSLLRFTDRMKYSSKSDIHLPIADLLQDFENKKAPLETISQFVETYIAFWYAKLSKGQAYTHAIFSRQCTDLAESVLLLWSFIVNHQSTNTGQTGFPEEILKNWEEQLRDIMGHSS